MFEAFLKYPREAYAQGELVFVNVADERLWLAGIGLILAVIVASIVFGRWARRFAWWQRCIVGVLQAVVVVGVIGLLAAPHLRTTKLEQGANNVAVLLDTSASMGFDGASQTPRIDEARALFAGPLGNELDGIGELALFTFAGAPSRVEHFGDVAARAQETNLIASLENVLQSFRGTPLAGVIVLSDGADNDLAAQSRVAELAGYAVPVHTIGFGPEELRGETILSDVRAATDAPPRSQVTAELVIEHSASGPAVVQVRDRGTLLAQRAVELPAGVPVVRTDLTFDSGDAGIRELTFNVVPPEGDVLAENNEVRRLLTVSERSRRILYLEGEPRWEYKFIRRALLGDDVVRLVSWIRTTDRKSYRQGVESSEELVDGFPASKAELYGYDLVILGSVAATTLSDEQHEWLEAYVAERGGSLLALAGREALGDGGWDVRPLARALPVKLVRDATATYGPMKGKAIVTREGFKSPLLFPHGEGEPGLMTLPELGDLQRLGRLKPAATTVLELRTDDGVFPLLVTQPYGLGMTAVLATATTWRWQMGTPADDARHSLFWRQLTRQLAESAPRPESVDLKTSGEQVEMLVWAREADFAAKQLVPVRARVTFPDRTETDIELKPSEIAGLHTGRFTPGGAGVARVDVTIGEGDGGSVLTRFLQTGVENAEHSRPVRNAALLERIAEVSGGAAWSAEDVSGLRERLSFLGAGIKSAELLPLWNLPALFALLVLLKLLEWGLRRLWGGL